MMASDEQNQEQHYIYSNISKQPQSQLQQQQETRTRDVSTGSYIYAASSFQTYNMRTWELFWNRIDKCIDCCKNYVIATNKNIIFSYVIAMQIILLLLLLFDNERQWQRREGGWERESECKWGHCRHRHSIKHIIIIKTFQLV